MSDPLLYEVLYQGRRHVGFGLPVPGAPQTLYPVAEGQLARAVVAGDGSADALRAALTDGATAVTVPADAPDLRMLPPMLPTASGASLLSGFMGTHKKKWGGQSAPEGEFTPPKWFFKG
ncbi:MAG TPA: fumarylacetoacetate (FAA) hydrolase, partial [Streptomyces sp.]|nr:fumarylacetoacetate (FAA) hydrolase [Streptomyces sp.]